MRRCLVTGTNHGLGLSAVYFFLILFFAIRAAAAWIGLRGPLAFDAPWLLILIVGAIVTLLLAVTPASLVTRETPLPAPKHAAVA